MENNALRLHFTVLDIDFVTAQYYGNVFAHSDQIPVPVRDVLVCNSGCDIEHDDGTLTLDNDKQLGTNQ
jgi:hypothetical protein